PKGRWRRKFPSTNSARRNLCSRATSSTNSRPFNRPRNGFHSRRRSKANPFFRHCGRPRQRRGQIASGSRLGPSTRVRIVPPTRRGQGGLKISLEVGNENL